MNASVSVITETWLSDGQSLDEDLLDLEHGAGIGFLCKNRTPGPRGVSHGGVGIAYKKNMIDMRKLEFHNPEDYEVLSAIGTMHGQTRKLVVVAAYIPPNYNLARGQGCPAYIADLVLELKRRYRDPYLLITGDFNQWDPTAVSYTHLTLPTTPYV